MLNRIGGSCCGTTWSRTLKISKYLLHTRSYAEWKETPKVSSALDFISKYDEQATEKILNVLNKTSANELARYDIAKTRVQKLARYRSTNGPFETIQQVLEVENFGAKVLEKLVVSIAESSNKKKPLADTDYKPPLRLINSVATPALDNEKRRSINTVTSITVSSKQISWAKIETSGRLLLWDSFNNFDLPKNDNPVLLHDLALKVRTILPASDVYVVEGAPSQQNSLNSQQNSGFSKVQCVQLNTMLVTLLATEFIHPNEAEPARWTLIENCFYLRRQITGHLFNLVVGNETVSARNVINQIIDNTIAESLAHIPPITIDFTAMGVYEKSDPVKKEALSQALLMAVAFADLAVNHNPLSLKALERKGIR